MAKYSSKMLEYFYKPIGAGTIKGASAIGKIVDQETGEILKLYLLVENNVIKCARFQTFGGVLPISIMSVLTTLVTGKTISEARNLSIYDIVSSLNQVPKNKFNTLFCASECLQNALKDYEKRIARAKKIKESGKEVKTPKIVITDVTFNYSGMFAVSLANETTTKVIEKGSEPQESQIKERKLKKQSSDASATNNMKNIKNQDEVALTKTSKIETQITNKSHEEAVNSQSPSMLNEKPVQPTKIEVHVVENEKTPEELFVEQKEQLSGKKSKKQKSGKGYANFKNEAQEKTVLKEVEPETASQRAKEFASKNETINTQNYIKHSVFEEKNNVSESDLIVDEIDTITARLSDALSQLNFKFDLDEEAEINLKSQKKTKKNK